MSLCTLEDIDRLAESLGGGALDGAGERALGLQLSRGDFVIPVEQRIVQQWLTRQAERRAAAAKVSPESLALRSTVAAEKSARWAMFAVCISVVALLLAAWPYFSSF